MKKKELKKVNGDVFFEAYIPQDKPYIYVNWIGRQSLETSVMGGNYLLSMLKEETYHGILNSNKELIGPWEDAVHFMAYKWAPAAKELGLHYFAHVLSPGIFGQKSFELFKQHLHNKFILRSFEGEDQAENWLLLHLS